MKVAQPESDPAEAVTAWGPATPGGTVKVVENQPEGDVVTVGFGVASYVNVTGTLAANPDPDTVSVEPTLPLVGLRTIARVTVKGVVSMLRPSEAVTVWMPATPEGTVKVVENEPEGDVIIEGGDVTCGTPSNCIVIGEEAAKPDPDTMIGFPAGPIVGLRLMDGLTNKSYEPWLELVSVITTTCLPALEAGIVNVAPVNEPNALVRVVLIGTGEPSYVIEIVEKGANPNPDTVTVEPTFPLTGLRAIDVVVVNDVEPLFKLSSVMTTV